MKSDKFVVHAAILVVILSSWKTSAAEPNEPRKLKAGDIKTPVIIGKYMCFESLFLRWILNDRIFFVEPENQTERSRNEKRSRCANRQSLQYS